MFNNKSQDAALFAGVGAARGQLRLHPWNPLGKNTARESQMPKGSPSKMAPA